MRHIVVGLALMVLAILVGVAFILELSGSGFGVRSPEYHDQDNILPEPDGETVTVTIENDRERLFGTPPPSQVENLLPEGLIPDWEKKNIDQEGYYHYRVQPYDTLSKLARIYLGRAELWESIMEHNQELTDPRDLREGVTIKIPLWLRDG